MTNSFNYEEMLEAIKMMGFEPLEMNFFRRIDEIEDESYSQLIMYCELFDDKLELNIYRDAMLLSYSVIHKPLDFIDSVEFYLNMYDIATAKLHPFDANTTINGEPIMAKSDRFSTRDFIKKLIRVKSSNLWSYAFQPKDYNKGDMLIQFKGANGGPDDIYIYYDVPSKLWQKFVAAPSKGHFMWQYIRNVFKYAKLTGDKRTHLPNGI